jgi:Na+-driven multidrug efflux pump
MSQQSEIDINSLTSNKRIAKNTILLYVRMFFVMCIQLYTSRIVLQALGVEDYGIYNVVGGIVTMFAFLNAAMNSSTQRYITFYLGKGDKSELQEVFSNCMFVHAMLAVVIIVLSETVGLWFLYNKMVIPAERMDAAFWVFQMSIITTVVLIFSTPYNATIIAYEKMSAFAYISIFEVILKLLTAFILIFSKWDNLVLYAVLTVIAQLIVRFIYVHYCNRHFSITKIVYRFNKQLFRSMTSFIGWNVWGGLSNVLYSQGLNILLNMFFGPVINAARGIAVQVQGVVQQFAFNLQTAINPQITKSYAIGELKSMRDLVYRCSRYTFFLLLIISLPIFLETSFLLNLWLTTVPEWTVSFTRIMLCIIMVDSVAAPLMTSSAATGNVKLYQTVIGGTMLLIVPVSYLLLKLGYNPSVVFFVHLAFCLMTFVLRLIIVRPMIQLSIREYLKVALWPCLKSGVLAIIIPTVLYMLLPNNLTNGVLVLLSSIIFSIIAVYLLGITPNERAFINQKVSLVFSFIKKK